jgi:hypothetical protein
MTAGRLRRKLCSSVILFALCRSVVASATPIYAFDFTTQPAGDAAPWLKEHGFEFKLSFAALNPRFENGALRLTAHGPVSGLCGHIFPEGSELHGVRHVRLTWGVQKYPEGADWERGNRRTAAGVVITFGYERISSGLPFGIFAAPYFICPFIGEKEIENKIYLGRFYRKGGRYICVKAPALDEAFVTDLEVDELFRHLFEKTVTPPITAVAIQMNTRDTQGTAAAFIKKIEFLDGE